MKGLEAQRDCPGAREVMAQSGAVPPGWGNATTLVSGGTGLEGGQERCFRPSSRVGMAEGG